MQSRTIQPAVAIGRIPTAADLYRLVSAQVSRLVAGHVRRQAERRTIAALSALSDHLLHDIGLLRAEIRHAARNPHSYHWGSHG